MWGLIGVRRGAEIAQQYRPGPRGGLIEDGSPRPIECGEVDMRSGHGIAEAWRCASREQCF
ncbi:hypothetical protein BN2475_400056 [Paraburkholderia ribeironis]|uniref:Uncharacterized protein n=1 Tax=Paraburkholderia ribeironis TaxID=1247936 RepID=A0A1N7S6P3_9BURK|nr:hypothetical protein BN2475_400056 [Paraburkholderia ribeironis]